MVEPQSRTTSCNIEREFCRVPVTALAFLPSNEGLLVLVAQDTDLRVYDAESLRHISQFPVFDGQPIHGLHVQENGSQACSVLVWGATHLVMFSADGLNNGAVPVMLHAQAPDWIYDGKISPYQRFHAALATAHNEAIYVEWHEATGEVVLGKPVSPSRPILSSAHLTWLSEDYVLVAGGSFFGEILVWKYHFGKDAAGAHEMLFVLTGHEGSVFGMHIAPHMTLHDGSSIRLLASCSDDRTIRVWDITEHRADGAPARPQLRLNDARETGFTSTPESDQAHQLEADKVEPIAVAMGHLSRIWSIHFSTPSKGLSDSINIYSFGEDATAQKWKLDLGSPKETTAPGERLEGKLLHQRTFALHTGKNLWAHALLSRSDVALIATGGADGQISLIKDPIPAASTAANEPSIISFPTNEVLTLDAHDIIAAIPPCQSRGGEKGELINRYDYIAENQVLVTTSLGKVLLGTFQEDLRWQMVEYDESLIADIQRCYILQRVGHGAAVLGTPSGNVYFYGPSCGLVHVTKLPGRVVSVRCLSDESLRCEQGTASIEVLIHLYGSSVGHYLVLNPVAGSLEIKEQVQGLDERFVPLSAAKIGQYLLIGSRHGFLCITKRVEGAYRPVLDMASQTRDGISAIIPLPTRVSTHSPYFLTTSRDGKYRIYEIKESPSSIELRLCHERLLPFGPFIEGAWLTSDDNPELIFYGFRSKNIVVWNETRRRELANVECGGAHRAFVLFHRREKPESLRLAYTRLSKLCLYRQESSLDSCLELGIHGREIRTVSSNGHYLATGSEDTVIRIWQHHKEEKTAKPGWKYILSVKAHVSGLQTLRWFGDDLLFSSSGYEEFFVWRLRRLETSCVQVGIVCEGVFKDTTKEKDPRIMDFDVSRSGSSDDIIITLGFSNTVLKTYRYTPDGQFHLLAKGAYTGACLTQVRHLGLHDDKLAVLTASTDGHLATWIATTQAESQDYVVGHLLQMHQSSIKSLEIIPVEDDFHVLTGGDDNALGHVMVSRKPQDSEQPFYRLSSRGIVRRAHAAAINGVAVKRLDNGDILGYSVSNDQKIKMWRLAEAETGRIELLADVYSGVADVCDVELIDHGRRIVLAGVGMEVWNLGT